MSDHSFPNSRRDFLKAGAFTGLGAAFGSGVPLTAAPPAGAPGRTRFRVAPIDPVRIGFVGVGGMGSAHVQNYMSIDGVEIKAVCDIVPAKVERIQKMCTDAGRPKPAGYSNGPWDFKRMCETERAAKPTAVAKSDAVHGRNLFARVCSWCSSKEQPSGCSTNRE